MLLDGWLLKYHFPPAICFRFKHNLRHIWSQPLRRQVINIGIFGGLRSNKHTHYLEFRQVKSWGFFVLIYRKHLKRFAWFYLNWQIYNPPPHRPSPSSFQQTLRCARKQHDARFFYQWRDGKPLSLVDLIYHQSPKITLRCWYFFIKIYLYQLERWLFNQFYQILLQSGGSFLCFAAIIRHMLWIDAFLSKTLELRVNSACGISPTGLKAYRQIASWSTLHNCL